MATDAKGQLVLTYFYEFIVLIIVLLRVILFLTSMLKDEVVVRVLRQLVPKLTSQPRHLACLVERSARNP